MRQNPVGLERVNSDPKIQQVSENKMKKIILVISLVSSAAFAGQSALHCKQVGTAIDDGYSVYVAKKSKIALVEEVTIAGPKTLATLQCVKTKVTPSHPDEIYTFLACSEPLIRDGGFSLQVKQGGIAGLTVATLSKITIVGPEQVAELSCEAVK